jgi:putative transposase
MDWKQLLASITGSVDEELRLRNAYLAAENRVLRRHIKGRVPLTDAERKTLAEMGQKLGRQALAEIATIATPDTILAWHRTFATQTYDRFPPRQAPGRPKIDRELEALVVRMAHENHAWGYDRIVGALANLGYTISDQTVGNILKRHGIPPAPERMTTTTWREFTRSHMDLLVATDFFTSEVGTWCGLVIAAILCFIRVGRRTTHVVGVTAWLHPPWIRQITGHTTMAAWGFLSRAQSLLHARDRWYVPGFQPSMDAAGVTDVPLSLRAPDVHAHAERWIGLVKEARRARFILYGELSLWHGVSPDETQAHQERPHGEKGCVLLWLSSRHTTAHEGAIHSRERVGERLTCDHRAAA